MDSLEENSGTWTRVSDLAASSAPVVIGTEGSSVLAAEGFREGNIYKVTAACIGSLLSIGLGYVVYRHRSRNSE